MIKAQLSKFKFALGFSPEVESTENYREFIPEPYSSVVLISADFELAWAWRYAKNFTNSHEQALVKASKERQNVPKILSLCEQFNIPITWATVGHLFLESCEKVDGAIHPEMPRLPHFENRYWKFEGADWYEHDPGSNYLDAPEWYCPDLIKQIKETSVDHEMACHTFSHIDCRDGVCPPELMRAELEICKELAEKEGFKLSSFVHPGHTIGNLEVLKEQGFTNYRTDNRNVLGYPIERGEGFWELEQTAEFNIRTEWSAKYHAKRYKQLIKRAIKTNTLCVFWFHPSFDDLMLDEVWPEVFEYLDQMRDKVWITTHEKYFEFLNKKQ